MASRRGRSPVPFRDASGQYLPWVIAVMVYLATLAMAGSLELRAAVAEWKRGVADRITVEVPAGLPDRRLQALIEGLRQTSGVAAVTPLSAREVEELLEPWLGRGSLAALPVPSLIDVYLDAGNPPDMTELGRRVVDLVPEAQIDDHKPWLDKLVTLGRSLQWLAGLVVALIGIATVALVGFATRAGLAVHHDVVELLHLIGARDSYVAKQFERHTLLLSVIGAVPGVLAAGLTLYGLSHLLAKVDAPMLPAGGFDLWGWLILLALPFVVVVMATVAARVTVLRLLRRML